MLEILFAAFLLIAVFLLTPIIVVFIFPIIAHAIELAAIIIVVLDAVPINLLDERLVIEPAVVPMLDLLIKPVIVE